MKREAHLPKSQKALRTMVDRINAQAQEKGTKHNRFSALPEGLLSGYKTFALPTEGNGNFKLYNAFTEHQRQFLTEKDGTIASRLSMSSAPSSQLIPQR
jgi:hypothetical protein